MRNTPPIPTAFAIVLRSFSQLKDKFRFSYPLFLIPVFEYHVLKVKSMLHLSPLGLRLIHHANGFGLAHAFPRDGFHRFNRRKLSWFLFSHLFLILCRFYLHKIKTAMSIGMTCIRPETALN